MSAQASDFARVNWMDFDHLSAPMVMSAAIHMLEAIISLASARELLLTYEREHALLDRQILKDMEPWSDGNSCADWAGAFAQFRDIIKKCNELRAARASCASLTRSLSTE